MWNKIKDFYKLRNVLILLLIFVCLWSCYNCSRTKQNGKEYTSTSQQIKCSQELAGRAGAENKSAGAAVSAAQKRAAEATAINQTVRRQLDECSELLKEIRADNQRAKQLLDEIITGKQKE